MISYLLGVTIASGLYTLHGVFIGPFLIEMPIMFVLALLWLIKIWPKSEKVNNK